MYPIGEHMTAEQFLALPEEKSRLRYELAHGEVVECAKRDLDHGFTLAALAAEVVGYVHDHSLGQAFGNVDTYFGPADVRAPDLLFFFNERLKDIGDQYVKAPPDLCIEIISPGSQDIDRFDKFQLYEHAAVSDYWIVDPIERTIEAYKLRRGKYALAAKGRETEDVILSPFDLRLKLKRLWRKYD